MSLARLIWNQFRCLNKLPGTHRIFYLLSNFAYGDRLVTIRWGPIAGFLWQHYRCYQPWMAMGLYEPDTAQFILRSLKPGNVFYDIGANAGYLTLVAAKTVGSSGTVVAFDPLPKNITTIEEQIEHNNLNEFCYVEPLAISDQSGTVKFAVPQRNANAHLADIEAPHIRNEKRIDLIEVQSTTLDGYLSDTEKPIPDMIKIDIEGAELKALAGAKTLLASSLSPILVITAHSEQIAAEVRAILLQSDYSIQESQSTFYGIPNRLNRQNV